MKPLFISCCDDMWRSRSDCRPNVVEQEGKVHGIRGAGVDELELPVEEIRRWVFFDEKAEDIVLCGGSFLGG